MNKPIIKDLTALPAETKNLKPIEIKGCLQINPNSQNYYYFNNGKESSSKNYLLIAKTISRLTRKGTHGYLFDLIDVDGYIHWGFWNDGVLPE